MDRISQIKTELLMKEWAEMVQECRSSGLTVKEWCINNGVNIKTYYYRLKRVRDFICDNKLVNISNDSLSSHHDIVPVPMDTIPHNDTRFAPKNTTSAQEASGYAMATREQAIALSLRIFKVSDMWK